MRQSRLFTCQQSYSPTRDLSLIRSPAEKSNHPAVTETELPAYIGGALPIRQTISSSTIVPEVVLGAEPEVSSKFSQMLQLIPSSMRCRSRRSRTMFQDQRCPVQCQSHSIHSTPLSKIFAPLHPCPRISHHTSRTSQGSDDIHTPFPENPCITLIHA